MRCNLGLKFVLGGLLAVFGMSAQAYTQFCVGSTAALAAALSRAQSASDTTVIELQTQGSPYHFDQVPAASQFLNAVKLLGGYDSTCANRVVNPENTVVDGGNKLGILGMQGSITVEGIRFQNFNELFTLEIGRFDYAVSGLTASIRNNEFIVAGLSVEMYCSDNETIQIDNNLIARSNGDGIYVGSYCGAADNPHATNTNPVELTGNTVVSGRARGIEIYSAGSTGLYNNIVWGNTGIDIYLQTGVQSDNAAGTALFDDNTFDSGSIFGNHGSGSGGDDSNDPQFIAPTSGNYRLQSTSPAVNTGDTNAPGLTSIDLDGNPRIVGVAPDRGAYESAVDDRTIGTTLTVTNTGDNGGSNPAPGAQTGTLRQAIVDANFAGGMHYIEFNINDGGSCPWIINTAADLPYISAPGLSINGFTQPGSKKNILSGSDLAYRCIVLNGGQRNQSMGLTFTGASSGFYWIQGLAFEGWGTALNISAGQNNLVWGNQFGGSLVYNAQQLTPNGIDIWLCGGTTTSTIGGIDPADRNIIAGAGASGSPTSPDSASYGGSGIAMGANCGSGGNTIVNNLIGMDASEYTTTNGNAVGIQLETADNAISGNVIGNNNNGIQVLGTGAYNNTIFDNLIGVTEPPVFCFSGTCPNNYSAANQAGIYFWQGAYKNYVVGNTITNNTLYGIELINGGTYENQIAQNSIYGNPASWATNGAEVNLDGYTYVTTYSLTTTAPPNNYRNYPIISSAEGSSTIGTITGYLRSTNDTYSIEVHSSPTCEAGGAYAHNPIGTTVITNTDATHHYDGTGTFSFNILSPLSLSGRYITATAIDSSGNTSQFSACQPYLCDVIFRHGFDSATAEKCQ